MMLDFKSLVAKHKISVRGIIQLGSHYWQESAVFVQMGIRDFVLVEPQKTAFAATKAKAANVPGALLFNCAVGDVEGMAVMECDEVNESQSSSLLTAKVHLEKYPSIQFTRKEKVEVRRLDNIPFERSKYNVLVMDLQGYELHALRGSEETLEHIDAIMTEINFEEMYSGGVLVGELDEYLSKFGFVRVATGDNTNNQGWSDALYLKGGIAEVATTNASSFDNDFYYEHNPDVKAAVINGKSFKDGEDHYNRHGKKEGRKFRLID